MCWEEAAVYNILCKLSALMTKGNVWNFVIISCTTWKATIFCRGWFLETAVKVSAERWSNKTVKVAYVGTSTLLSTFTSMLMKLLFLDEKQNKEMFRCSGNESLNFTNYCNKIMILIFFKGDGHSSKNEQTILNKL